MGRYFRRLMRVRPLQIRSRIHATGRLGGAPPLDFIFADDSRQDKPTRLGVGSLIAIGGVHVPEAFVGELEVSLQRLCDEFGFPPGQQFKWSPGKDEEFMRRELVDERRAAFYRKLFAVALAHDVTACVVLEDRKARPARAVSEDHEHDATALFLERIDSTLRARKTEGLVIVAEPSGGPKDQAQFLARCIELRRGGTEYTAFDSLPLGVLIARSRQLRLLQLADIVTSCVMSRVCGEMRYSQEVFDELRPLLQHADGRIGGVGVKIHPDFRYGNLYHWLLGDAHIIRGGVSTPLPERDAPFAEHSNEPEVVKGLLHSAKRVLNSMRPKPH